MSFRTRSAKIAVSRPANLSASVHTAATLYSVVQSARLYHLDVTAYLTDVVRQLPAMLPTDTDAIRSLLPDHWANSHPQHLHSSRNQELQAATARRRRTHAKRREVMAVR